MEDEPDVLDDYTGRDRLSDAIGYDLVAAVHNNPGKGLSWVDLEGCAVLYELTGDNDGPDWHWIVLLADGRHAYINGGCDYTGWDCRSSIDIHLAASLAECMALVGQDQRRIFEEMSAAGEKVRKAVHACDADGGA